LILILSIFALLPMFFTYLVPERKNNFSKKASQIQENYFLKFFQ